MLGLFTALQKEYNKQEDCVLAVVIGTTGSAPRGAGAYMVVNAFGRVWGTIGGGETEYEAQCQAQKQLELQRNKLCTYNLTPQAEKMCGGMQIVLLNYVDMHSRTSREHMAKVLELAASGNPFNLYIPYVAGSLQALLVHGAGDVHRTAEFDKEQYYQEQFNYDGTVYVFGGGHVAQELVPVLSHLDFRCVVVDDRPEFANKELFPTAATAFPVDYTRLDNYLQPQERDYLCIMTRAHTYDTEVERFALHTAAGYIGVMGSKFKAQMTRTKLLEEGFSEADIARVITPIGLSINSETPAEIAISIATQLIQERARRYK